MRVKERGGKVPDKFSGGIEGAPGMLPSGELNTPTRELLSLHEARLLMKLALSELLAVERRNPKPEVHRVKKCDCPYRGCTDYHVAPCAALQGVNFTEQQARAVAAVLNAMDS